MQQFGFSATDVKLKQWDETPKFGSNANIQPLRRYLWHADAFPLSAKASSLSETLPKQPMKTHPFGENCRFVKAIPQSR